MVHSTTISLYVSISLIISCVVAVPMPMDKPPRRPFRPPQKAADTDGPLVMLSNTQIRALYEGKKFSDFNCVEVEESDPRAQAMIAEFDTEEKDSKSGNHGKVIKPADYKASPPHHRTVLKFILADAGAQKNSHKIMHEIAGLERVNQLSQGIIVKSPDGKKHAYLKMKKIEGVAFQDIGTSSVFHPFTEKGPVADKLWVKLQELTIAKLMAYAEKRGAAHMDVGNKENLILQGKGTGEGEFKPAAIDWAQWVPIPQQGEERVKLLERYKKYLDATIPRMIRETKGYVYQGSGASSPHTAPESSTGGTPPKGATPQEGNSPRRGNSPQRG
ncbi:hypothetical protein CVT24_004181 [Panaeolus cyanescens]|uniref:Uncharacterized protein n=1 Tax=Panaeolus cyanescens TaxID=181874 RepID=A0A409X096_9AGAR|nr:hypothetical protein CVT24_004181 [Panaeolus cyanescens]